MIVGYIDFDAVTTKYVLTVDGRVISKSADRGYFEYYNGRGTNKKLDAEKIDSFVYRDDMQSNAQPFVQTVVAQTAATYVEPDVNVRFQMMEQLVDMTIAGDSKAMLITGRGGVGKTHTVLQRLANAGKTDFMKMLHAEEPVIDDQLSNIDDIVDDLATDLGDYVVFKGYATPAALYSILYEHRNRIVIFDDCDSVLRDPDAINVLKSALDTYEDRWVSWNIKKDSDLPACFKFQGQVIFISNMPMAKIAEPIRTRCFKVDVSMTPAQRIERMRAVLPTLMPHIDIAFREEALELMNDNRDTLTDLSFRALMSTITIRNQGFANWQELALYSLHQD